MSPVEFIEFFNQLTLILGVVGMAGILVVLGYRVWQYKRAGWDRPRLLNRDIILFGGLILPFLAIFVRRALQIDVADQLWWNIVTAVPAIIAIYYWLWEELRTVGKQKK